jgi:predicted transcriptional regulator
MPLVKPSNTTPIKLSLSDEIADELTEYAEWAQASRAKVVRIALERLFKDDEEWQAKLERDAEAAQD